MRRGWAIVAGIFNVIPWLVLLMAAVFAAYLTGDYAANHLTWWSGFTAALQAWSTLITGMLAVAAATGTIYVMHRTDRAQEKRHYDLMRLSIKPDRLLVQRAADPHILFLRMSLDSLTAMIARLDVTLAPNGAFLVELRERMQETYNEMLHENFVNAKGLYEPELYYRYGEMRKAADKLYSANQTLDLLFNSGADKQAILTRVVVVVGLVEEKVDAFTSGLELLSTEYDKYKRPTHAIVGVI